MVGLGYDLTAAAEYVLCNFGGEVPDVWPDLRAIPGVRDYNRLGGAVFRLWPA